MSQQQFFNVNDSLMDSEDLMSWLLLNPEVDFDNLTTALSGVVAESVAQSNAPSVSFTSSSASSAAVPVIPLVTQPVEYFKTFGPDTSSENLTGMDNSLKRSYSNYSLHTYHSGNNLNGLGSANTYIRKSNDNLAQSYVYCNDDPQSLPLHSQLRYFGSNSNEANFNGFAGHEFVKSNSNNQLNSYGSNGSGGSSKKVSNKSSTTKKRPRESLEDLEARVKELKAENADLHAHLLNVTQRTTEVQKQRVSMERLMAQKLSEVEHGGEVDQGELSQIVKQYTDIYADYGRCRQREQLEKLIVPTLTTKMCLWTLQQDKSFYQRNKSPMYDLLCKELEITPEQTEKIQERRERIKYLLAQLKESLDLLQSLKDATEKKHASYDHVCGRVQDAAQPKQTVRFLMWIAKNADRLAKHIPGFGIRASYIPNVEFVEELSNQQSCNK